MKAAELMARKTKSISKLRDSSERTHQHSNFMDCGAIRKDEGTRREERSPEDKQDNGETVDVEH